MPQTCEEHFEEEPYRYSDSETDTDSDPDNMDIGKDQDPEVGGFILRILLLLYVTFITFSSFFFLPYF